MMQGIPTLPVLVASLIALFMFIYAAWYILDTLWLVLRRSVRGNQTAQAESRQEEQT